MCRFVDLFVVAVVFVAVVAVAAPLYSLFVPCVPSDSFLFLLVVPQKEYHMVVDARFSTLKLALDKGCVVKSTPFYK